MQVILKKTVNSKFIAGSVIKGEDYRLKRLITKGVAVADSNSLSTKGSIINILFSAIMLSFGITVIINQISDLNLLNISVDLGIWTFILSTTIYSLFINIAYFLNKRFAAQATAFGLVTSFIGGIMIAVGDNRITEKYGRESTKRMGILITSFLMILSLISFITIFCFDYFNLFEERGDSFNRNFKIIMLSIMYGGLLIAGITGTVFDRITFRSRTSFINWIIKINEKETDRKLAEQRTREMILSTNEAKLDLEKLAELNDEFIS